MLKFQNLKTNKQTNKQKQKYGSWTKLLAKGFIKPIKNKSFSIYYPLVIKFPNKLRVDLSRLSKHNIEAIQMRPGMKFRIAMRKILFTLVFIAAEVK